MNLALAAVAAAALSVAPGAGYIYPPVMPAGRATEVQFGGYEFTPDVELHSLDPGVTIERLGPPGDLIVPEPPYWFGQKSMRGAFPIPRELPARITVGKEVSPGITRWQAANAGGASGTAPYLIESGRVVVENRHRADPQTLDSLPVTVAARLGRIAEVDCYNFTAAQNGPVTAELITGRLGSGIHGVIEIRESNGVHVADVVNTDGRDCELTFAAEAGKTYSARVFDVDFRGNQAFVYALRITPGPRVLMTRPNAGRPSQTREIEFIGYGLETNTAQLERVTRKIDFPDQQEPTFPYNLKTPAGSTSVSFRLEDFDELVEPEGNEFSGPIAINGTLDHIGQEDRYTLEMSQGDTWSLAVEARVLGSPLDPVLRVLAPDGSELAKNDDAEGTSDCALEITAATDGPHTIVISDVSSEVGSPLSIYRFVAKRPHTDFSLSIPPSVSFEAGGKASIAVKVARSGGYQGAVALEVKGLPAGITAPTELQIPADKNELNIELTTNADCATTSTYLSIVGVGTIGSRSVKHVSRVLVSRTMQVPVSISWVGRETQHERPRGSTFPAELKINRQDGYNGQIWLMMSSKQSRHRQGIRGPIMKVPEGARRVFYPVFLPEWLETFRTSRLVIFAVAEVVDPQGESHYVLSPSGRLCIIVEGALMKVDGGDAEIEALPGEAFEIPVDVLRRPNFTEDVTLEITVADDVDELFQAAPVVVPTGQTRATVRVETTAAPRLYPEQQLTVRATALQDGKWLAVSETDVTVVFTEKVAAR